jgi:hypothetical protein
MKKKFLTAIMAMSLTLSLLAGCGNNTPEATQEEAESQEAENQEAPEKSEESKPADAGDITGHWQLMCELSHIEPVISEKDFPYCPPVVTFADGNFNIVSFCIVHNIKHKFYKPLAFCRLRPDY